MVAELSGRTPTVGPFDEPIDEWMDARICISYETRPHTYGGFARAPTLSLINRRRLHVAQCIRCHVVAHGRSRARHRPSRICGPAVQKLQEAHTDGRYNIPSNDPAYSPKRDRDGDGDGFAREPYKRR